MARRRSSRSTPSAEAIARQTYTSQLAPYGYSNYDCATAVAAAASEALREGVRGLAAVADVGRNRHQDAIFGGKNYGQRGSKQLGDIFTRKFPDRPYEFNGIGTKFGQAVLNAGLRGQLERMLTAQQLEQIDEALVTS
jgi:hypothetical protein